ncbi:hypothetical protein Hte_010676 [Hypoxylon texense]
MATSGVSESKDDEVVVVNLFPRPSDNSAPSSPFHTRQFYLSRQRPFVRVGRASKLPSKGFVSSTDNAWFESPVMSRHHAEFVLDSESTPKGVFIKDIGSLHGTYHTPCSNSGGETRLEQQQLVKLSSGDSLRFGTDIFRSKETYPPLVVGFYAFLGGPELDHPTMATADETANRAFAFYDPDEEEDEQDDDSVIETGVTSSQTQALKRGPSIDLTQDEDDENWSTATKGKSIASTLNHFIGSDVIDLTSEPEEYPVGEPGATNTEYSLPPTCLEPPASECPPKLAAAIASHAARYFPPAVEDVPEDVPEMENSSIADNQTSSQENLVNYFDRYNGEISSVVVQPADTDIDSELADTDIDSELDSEVDSAVTEGSVSDMSDVDVDDVEVGDVDIDAEDDYSSTSQVDEDAEAYDSMDDDLNLSDIPYSDDDTSSSDGSTDSLSSPSSPAPDSSLDSAPLPPVSKEAVPQRGSADPVGVKNPFVTPFLFTAAAVNTTTLPPPRHPSPSDAAMFKSHPLYDQEPSDARAHALGEKTGKYEYFSARENNRTNLADPLPPPPISAVRETLNKESEESFTSVLEEGVGLSTPFFSRPVSSQTQAADEPVDTVDTMDAVSTANATTNTEPQDVTQDSAQDAAHVDLKASAATQKSPWSMSGERFINNPGTEDLPGLWASRAQSPDFDMTSAYAFQQSKMATESGASQHPRRVGIQDLLTQEPKNNRGAAIANHLPPITISPPSPYRAINEVDGTPVEENVQPTIHRSSGSYIFRPRRALKRTHEDAFADNDDLPGQDDSHAGSSDGPNPRLTNDETLHAALLAGESTSEASLLQAQSLLRSIAIPARRDNVQPSKKRRFAQAAACVALGGAAAFTFMVSTAPVL